LENAIRYAPNDSCIQIQAFDADSITVCNKIGAGKSIDVTELNAFFKSTTRSLNSTGRHGFGLQVMRIMAIDARMQIQVYELNNTVCFKISLL
jgi:K+-sensing histidine kinase KdpD